MDFLLIAESVNASHSVYGATPPKGRDVRVVDHTPVRMARKSARTLSMPSDLYSGQV